MDDKKNTTFTAHKESEKASLISANELFYKSHVSGFSGIKKKYQANKGLNMKKIEELKTQYVQASFS